MDRQAVKTELSRILDAPNPYQYCLEETSADDSVHQYYYKDRHGTTTTTALHRLVALHLKVPETVSNFLKAASRANAGDDDMKKMIRQQTLTTGGATALHVAVFRNSWHVDKICHILLDSCPELANIPMLNNTYPLHVLFRYNLTISPNLVNLLLQYGPHVVHIENSNGDTPLSLLYENVMRFRWARSWEQHCGGGQQAGSSSWPIFCHKNKKTKKWHRDLANMTIISPEQYLVYSLQLLEHSATVMNNKDKKKDLSARLLSWHDVCGTPRCPPLLIRMLLVWHHQVLTMQQQQRTEPPNHHHGEKRRKCEGSEGPCDGGGCCPPAFIADPRAFKTRDFQGRLPLHCVCAVPCLLLHHNNNMDDETNHINATATGSSSVVELVLAYAPCAASVPDAFGRLPIHYALSNPSLLVAKHHKAILALVRTFPTALTIPDPFTGLYPAQQLAAAMVVADHQRRHRAPTTCCSPDTSREQDGGDGDEVDTNSTAVRDLDSLYRLLRTQPDVCGYHRRRGGVAGQ